MKQKTINSIIFGAAVDEFNKVYAVDIRGASRKRELVYYRYCFAYIGRNDYYLKVAEIGGALNRDHATAVYYLKNYKQFANQRDKHIEKSMSEVNEIFERVDIPYSEFVMNYSEMINTMSARLAEIFQNNKANVSTIDRVIQSVKSKTIEKVEKINSRIVLS